MENKRFARFLMACAVFVSLVASPAIAATDDDSVATVVGADGKILTAGNIADENFAPNSSDSVAEGTKSITVEARSDAGSVEASPTSTPVEVNAKANDPSATVSGDAANNLEAQAEIIREIQELWVERCALQKRLAEHDEKIAELTKELKLLQKQDASKSE